MAVRFTDFCHRLHAGENGLVPHGECPKAQQFLSSCARRTAEEKRALEVRPHTKPPSTDVQRGGKDTPMRKEESLKDGAETTR